MLKYSKAPLDVSSLKGVFLILLEGRKHCGYANSVPWPPAFCTSVPGVFNKLPTLRVLEKGCFRVILKIA